MVADVLVIITTYEENRFNISIECRSKTKQNVLFQRFKQKMTEATLLKGNSTSKHSGLMIMQHLQHKLLAFIEGAVQLCKRSPVWFLCLIHE